MITALLPIAPAPSASPSTDRTPGIDVSSMPPADRALVRRAIASAAGSFAEAHFKGGSALVHFLKAFAGDPRTGGGGGGNSEDKKENKRASGNNNRVNTAATEQRSATPSSPENFMGRRPEEEQGPRPGTVASQNIGNTRSNSATGGSLDEREVAISLATPQSGAGAALTSTTGTATVSPTAATVTAANQHLATPSIVVGTGSSGSTVVAGANPLSSKAIVASAGPASDLEHPIELGSTTA